MNESNEPVQSENADAHGTDGPDALRNTALAPQRDASGRYLSRDPRGAPPFAPGSSGNPGGRPRGASILAPFLRALARGSENDPDGYGALAVELGEGLASALRDGDHRRAQAILAAIERTDGPIERRTVRETRQQRVVLKLSGAPLVPHGSPGGMSES